MNLRDRNVTAYEQLQQRLRTWPAEVSASVCEASQATRVQTWIRPNQLGRTGTSSATGKHLRQQHQQREGQRLIPALSMLESVIVDAIPHPNKHPPPS